MNHHKVLAATRCQCHAAYVVTIIRLQVNDKVVYFLMIIVSMKLEVVTICFGSSQWPCVANWYI